MYEQLFSEYRNEIIGFPQESNLDLGLAIKQIRLRLGLTQAELALAANMKPNALKTLENGYAKFTTTANLEAIANALHIPVEDILNEAREWFPGNFYVLKSSTQENSPRKRRSKYREEIWQQKKILKTEAYHMEFITPPVKSGSNFHFAIITLQPGQALKDLALRYPTQVIGFVLKGALKINYQGDEYRILANQGFCLRGDIKHSCINHDSKNPAVFCITFSFSFKHPLKEDAPFKNMPEGSFACGRGINRLRYLFSRDHLKPLSFSALGRLTGMDEKSLQYLEKTVHPNQVIYWDKIEKMTQSLRLSLKTFILLAQGKNPGYFQIVTAHDRALIDYRHYLGVRIKSALFPSPDNHSQIFELLVEPKGGIRRASWKRSDQTKIAAYVDEGEILIEVGKNRKVNLKAGESVYFDGLLGYNFTNPGAAPAKILLAVSPPIIF